MDSRPPSNPAEDWHLTDDLHAESGKGDPFAAAIRATRMPMIITNPRRPDNPIVFANGAFLRLTGYSRDQVIGRNCRFLQGPETDPETVDKIRKAIADGRDVNVDILNYRQDGSAFWNALYISPVSNEAGELQFFFASQLDVTERANQIGRIHAEKEEVERAVRERTRELEARRSELEAALEARTTLLHEVDHRVKNNLQMISSLIVMQSRSIPDEGIRKSLRAMLERVEALSTVHRRLYQSDDVSRFDVSEFVRDLVRDLVGASGREDIKVDLNVEPVEVSAERAAPIALIVNELVTNALKHAFPDGRGGTLGARVTRDGERFRLEIADDGKGMVDGDGKTFGTRLVKSLSRQLNAETTWQTSPQGTRVIVDLPL